MNETIALLLSYIPAFWRRRWLMLVVVWLVCLIGWTIVAFIPNKYASMTRVYVDTENLLRPLLRGLAVETNMLRQVDIMQQTLVSQPNLEKVVQMADLNLGTGLTIGSQKLIGAMRENIKITSERNNLFTISFSHKDPQVAQKVVQSLLTIFVEGNLGTSRREMDAAQQFIGEQIDNYEKQMNEAEEKISSYKQANITLLPGDRGFYAHLTKSSNELALLKDQHADAVAKAGSLEKRLNETPEYLEFDSPASRFGSGPPSGLHVRIMEIENSLDSLLLKYTEKHPDVISQRRLLADLRQRLQEEMQAPAEGQVADGNGKVTSSADKQRVPNEVYQSIKLQLVGEQARIASLNSQISRQQSKVILLEEQAKKVPEVEAELARLERDHGIVKRNYEELLKRKETAVLSQSRDEKGDKVQFRIVDPPKLPVIPTGIKRSTYLTMVLGVGVFISLGIGGLFATAQSTFFSVLRLMQATATPVLGSVTMLVGSKRQESWQMLRLGFFVLACVSLLGSYGSLMVIERNVGLPNMIPPEVSAAIMEKLPSALLERLQ